MFFFFAIIVFPLLSLSCSQTPPPQHRRDQVQLTSFTNPSFHLRQRQLLWTSSLLPQVFSQQPMPALVAGVSTHSSTTNQQQD